MVFCSVAFLLVLAVLLLLLKRDSAQSWVQTSAPIESWSDISSSSTGQFLAAVIYQGNIYTSSNYGSTLTKLYPIEDWEAIASDSTGQYLAAVGGGIYTSSNYGSTWTLTSAPYNVGWYGITSSSTGQYLAAVVGYDSSGGIYTSSNYGSTWTLTSAPNNQSWNAITSSSSGQFLAAVVGGGYNRISGAIYTYNALIPSALPTTIPSEKPTFIPSRKPSSVPSPVPTIISSYMPTIIPSRKPSSRPSPVPTIISSYMSTIIPSPIPSSRPSPESSPAPSSSTHFPEMSPAPSSASSSAFFSATALSAIGALIILVGIILSVVGLLAVFYGRFRGRKNELNQLGSPYVESLDLLLRGTNIVFSFLVIATSATRPPYDFLGMLLASKLLIALAWSAFCWKLLRRDDVNGVSLLYGCLKQKYIGVNASACDKVLNRLLLLLALLDLNLLRLLPWTRTRSTGALNGFPDAFTLRLVLFGSCAAYFIAAVASIVGVSLADSSTGLDPDTAITFAALSILNTVRMFFSTATSLMSAKFGDPKLALVDESLLSPIRALSTAVDADLEAVIDDDAIARPAQLASRVLGGGLP